MRRVLAALTTLLLVTTAAFAADTNRKVEADALKAQAAMIAAPLSCSVPALTCSVPVTSSPSCPSSQYYFDFYVFTAVAGQTVTLTTTTSTGYQMLVTIQDYNTGAVIVSNYGPSPVSLTYTFPTSGPYAIGFGYVAYYATGTYTITASCGGSSCTPDTHTACLLNNRFKVTVKYRGVFDNNAADTAAWVKSVTGFANANYETAFFYFNDSNNIEMMVKMLDQGNKDTSNRPTIAVLFGSATPLRMELTITDMANPSKPWKTYTSYFNSQTGATDFTAFVK